MRARNAANRQPRTLDKVPANVVVVDDVCQWSRREGKKY